MGTKVKVIKLLNKVDNKCYIDRPFKKDIKRRVIKEKKDIKGYILI
jgi:hypothetical protein